MGKTDLKNLTSKWLDENDPKRATGKKRRKGPESLNGREPRDILMGTFRPETIKSFVDRHRGHDSNDCLFVPGSVKGAPANVTFCGRQITASRYMTLITHGTPKSEGMVSRHLCGNGHLSCVNPAHLVWGTPSQNRSDENKHRNAGENVQDRIHSIDTL